MPASATPAATTIPPGRNMTDPPCREPGDSAGSTRHRGRVTRRVGTGNLTRRPSLSWSFPVIHGLLGLAGLAGTALATLAAPAQELEAPVRLEAGGKPIDLGKLAAPFGHAGPALGDVDGDG